MEYANKFQRVLRCSLLCLLLVILLAAAPLRAVPATVATFIVTSTGDATDATPGDGLCADAAGQCTLRAAVQEANALSGDDTIDLGSATYTLTIPGAGENNAATGDLDIGGNLSIVGDGGLATFIDGNGLVTGDRIFEVFGDATVTMQDLTMSRGRSLNPGGCIRTVGILNLTEVRVIRCQAAGGSGGGIWAKGPLTITGGSISNNQAYKEGGGTVYGGGIYTEDVLTITGATLSENKIKSFGLGYVQGSAVGCEGCSFAISDSTFTLNEGSAAVNVYNFGAGDSHTIANSTFRQNSSGAVVFNTGAINPDRLTISDSHFENNRGNGAVYASAELVVLRSTFIGNATEEQGGAIDANDVSVTIDQSTFIGNTAGDRGGALYVGSYLPDEHIVTVSGSTFANNSAQGKGGAIYSFAFLNVVNSTISGNLAVTGGGVYNGDSLSGYGIGIAAFYNTTLTGNRANTAGGLYNLPGRSVTLYNTLLAANSDMGGSPDCQGLITSGNYNFLGWDDGCDFIAAPQDIIGNTSPIDPLLGPLQNNGGPTWTRALLTGSPAIDAANPAGCLDHNGVLLATDQRGSGYPRPKDGDGNGSEICDMGAFEK